jgi:HlyD family secretion protein
LAQLDDRPHQAELDKAAAGLRLAEADVKQARARRNQANLDFQRAERLHKTKTNSEAEFENALSQYEVAEAELAMSEARVEQAKAAKKQAEINLGYTTIRSPVNGTVIARHVNVGQTVVAGTPCLFLLARDLSRMQVWAAVNEADIGDVHVGQKVTFKVDTYRDRTFTGKVRQKRLDASMVASVVTYGVVVDADNTDGKLMPYMTAKLQFEVARRSDVPLIADQALRWRPTWDQVTLSARAALPPPVSRKPQPGEEKEGEGEAGEPTVELATPTAWVRADDGLVRPVPVKLGLSDGIVTELTGGELQVKDEVVINTVHAAKADFVSSFVNKVIKK